MRNKNARNVFRIAWCLVVLALPLFGKNALAQKVEVQIQQGPYYTGVPLLIRVSAAGFDEAPAPECKPVNISNGLDWSFAGVRENASERIVVRNGQYYRTRTVVFQFDYHVTAKKAGEFEMGPFEVTQGSTTLSTKKVSLTVGEIEVDDDMHVDLRVPAKAVFPGQRVPVTVEWGYAGDLDAVQDLRIQSTLFDLFPFEDDTTKGEAVLPIDPQKGRIGLQAKVKKVVLNGKNLTMLTATRTMIPDKPGRFEIPPVTATINKVVRWRADFFGGRRAAAAVPMRSAGKPLVIEVKPFPMAGRPESFAGAVGTGFSVSLAANRTVVRVGDPIKLTITLRGNGNLENASLPTLSADGGMDPQRFRLPQEDATGLLAEGSKQFEVNVRVSESSVSEIPAIAYSWFNPETEKYETTRSKPIALRVDEAKIVSAGDVISNAGSHSSTASPEGEDPKGTGQGARQAMTLTGADLALEINPAQVLATTRSSLGGMPFQISLYIAGFALVALALLERRRQSIPSEIAERRAAMKGFRHRIQQADKQHGKAGAEEIADALRGMMACQGDACRSEAERIIAECETFVYAPDSDGDISRVLCEDALKAADKMIKETG